MGKLQSLARETFHAAPESMLRFLCTAPQSQQAFLQHSAFSAAAAASSAADSAAHRYVALRMPKFVCAKTKETARVNERLRLRLPGGWDGGELWEAGMQGSLGNRERERALASGSASKQHSKLL